MKHIGLSITVRQANLIVESLRTQLREFNYVLDNHVLNESETLELQSNANVIRATMQAVKDELYNSERN